MKKLLFTAVLLTIACVMGACAREPAAVGERVTEENDQTRILDERMADRIYKVGDTVVHESMKTFTESEVIFNCTVTDAVLYRNIADCGVPITDMTPGHIDMYIPNDPNSYGISPDEIADSGYGILLVTTDITNIAMSYGVTAPNITEIYECDYRDPETGILNTISLPVYLDAPGDYDAEAGQYYWFDVQEGETVTATIGWLVDLDIYEPENLYLSVGGPVYIEQTMQFIALELGDEDIR